MKRKNENINNVHEVDGIVQDIAKIIEKDYLPSEKNKPCKLRTMWDIVWDLAPDDAPQIEAAVKAHTKMSGQPKQTSFEIRLAVHLLLKQRKLGFFSHKDINTEFYSFSENRWYYLKSEENKLIIEDKTLIKIK